MHLLPMSPVSRGHGAPVSIEIQSPVVSKRIFPTPHFRNSKNILAHLVREFKNKPGPMIASHGALVCHDSPPSKHTTYGPVPKAFMQISKRCNDAVIDSVGIVLAIVQETHDLWPCTYNHALYKVSIVETFWLIKCLSYSTSRSTCKLKNKHRTIDQFGPIPIIVSKIKN